MHVHLTYEEYKDIDKEFILGKGKNMMMKFIKMHGAGNDYVYVDCTKEKLPNASEAAVKVSDRHFGIGSDGLILVEASDKADFFMNMYNADGSRGKMCGNGIRCVGKFVYDNGLTDKTSITVDTLSGVKRLELHLGEERLYLSLRWCRSMRLPLLTAWLRESLLYQEKYRLTAGNMR